MEEKKRLASLDILRGFDMWLLLMAGPIMGAVFNSVSDTSLVFLRTQMDHVSWDGFHVWDIIMPLFMFLSGATVPFSMARYKNGSAPDRKFFFKLAKRVLLLFFLGWIVQGHLLDFEWRMWKPYANTLQAIAVGYLFSALIFVFLRGRWQVVVTFLLFLAYFLAFVFTGMNLDNQGNVAMLVDKAILGSHRDGIEWLPTGWEYADRYDYTWILSSLNFTVTVMLGCFAGQIMKSPSKSGEKKTGLLAVVGLGLIAAALLIEPYFPIIKKIWSSSMTLFSGGICFLLMALTYYAVDVKGWTKGLGWLKYYGMNAICAYMIGEVISFSSVSCSVLHGLEHIVPQWYMVIVATLNTLILFFILRHMYRKGVFLKL